MHPNNVDGELAPVALVEVSIINYNIAAKDIVMYDAVSDLMHN